MSSKFTFQITEDGSPTLEILRTDGKIEKMHHFLGAFSETLHVYGRSLELALQKGLPPEIFSLGLGLGYNEIMSVVIGLKHKVSPVIWSFETEENLKKQFRSWCEGVAQDAAFERVYNEILVKMCGHFEVNESAAKLALQTALREGQLKILGGYDRDFPFDGQKFSVIFYDAFSDKISPELWDLTALEYTLDHAAHSQVVFATYASKGRLKRALKERKFEILDIRGYGSKRECTIATRFTF